MEFLDNGGNTFANGSFSNENEELTFQQEWNAMIVSDDEDGGNGCAAVDEDAVQDGAAVNKDDAINHGNSDENNNDQDGSNDEDFWDQLLNTHPKDM